MTLEPFVFVKAVATSLGKISKALVTVRADWQRLRAHDQAALERTISAAIKRYPDRSALGNYLRCRKEREIIRAVTGLTPSSKELPAVYAYMEEAQANERDLRLAWPHRVLSPDGTFDFKLGAFERLTLWSSMLLVLLFQLGAAGELWIARHTPRLTPLQAAQALGLIFALFALSALPVYSCTSITATLRIQHRRARYR